MWDAPLSFLYFLLLIHMLLLHIYILELPWSVCVFELTIASVSLTCAISLRVSLLCPVTRGR